MLDGVEFGNEIVELVKGYVEREVTPLKAENESLKARLAALEALPGPEKGEDGEKGQDGVDGASPAPEAVAEALRPIAEAMISEAVSKAVAELPPPEKGEAGERGEKGEPGDAGADGHNGVDGRGVKELLIDRDGQLIATMDDGELKSLGPICGKDGEAGKDGRDGFGFEDMDVCVLGDDRTIELSFKRGEDEKAFTLKWPTVIDRGPFKIDRELPYESGDGVTWGGQFYICNEPTNEKPDLSKDGKPWRLAIRKGRDGKDAKHG